MSGRPARLLGLAAAIVLAICSLYPYAASKEPGAAMAAGSPAATSKTAPAASSPAAVSTSASADAAGLSRYFGFGEMETLKLGTGLGKPIIADINGDGLNDIIMVNNAKSRIDILLQKKDFKPSSHTGYVEEGDDVNDIFGKEINWRFKRVSYDLDVAVTALEVADIHGDGLPGLVYYSKSGLYIVAQQPPGHARTLPAAAGPRVPVWLPHKKIDIQEGLATEDALACGDLNGHGRTDIALLADDGVFVLLQKPDGTFAQPVRYPSGSQHLRQVYIADVDGGGRNDLVLLTADEEYPIRVRFQDADGKLGPEVRFEMPAPAVMQLIQLGVSRQNVFASVAAGSGRVSLHALVKNPQQAAHTVLNYPMPSAENAGDRDMVAADIEGNGILDVVISDPERAEFMLFRGQPNNYLGTMETFPGMMDMCKLCAADLDGKGKSAIIALSVKEKLIGISRMDKGRLSFPESVPVVGDPEAMDVADLAGDGKNDLVYVAKDKATSKYFLRSVLSLGAADAKAGPELELPDLKDKPLDVRAAGVGGEGLCDVMILCPYGPMLLVHQTQKGKFAAVTGKDVHAGLVADVTAPAMSIAPLGPKGQPAVLLAQKNFVRSLVFDAKNGWTVVDQYSPADARGKLRCALAAKLEPNAAAYSIVTYDNVRGKLGILARQADGTYRPDQEVDVGHLNARKIVAGNFGGPSTVSLLVCGSDQLVLVPLAGPSRIMRKLAGFETQIKDARFGAMAVGNLNSAAVPDIALVDQVNGYVEIVTFNAHAELVSAFKFKVYEAPRPVQQGPWAEREKVGEPRDVVIGDVTGRGKGDLILQVHDRIIIYPQD